MNAANPPTGELDNVQIRPRRLCAQLLSQSAAGPTRLDPQGLVDVAAEVVPYADCASMTLLDERSSPRTIAASDETARAVDELQYQLGAGPSLDAAGADHVVHTGNLADDERWANLGPLVAAQADVCSAAAIWLMTNGTDRVVLNLYARRADAFDGLDAGDGALLAVLAGLALEAVQERNRVANLETALASSRHIGMAMGILMSSRLLTADEALTELREASQHLHRKLRDLAIEVTETGMLPALPPPRTDNAE